MKSLRQFFLSISALIYSSLCVAQDTTENVSEQAVGMRADGKIYVVIAIVLTILFILIAYLAIVDRKVGRFEKQNK